MLVFLMIRLTKLLVVVAFGGSVACVLPVRAQTFKSEPDPKQLSCGQKVLVENNTCPAGQILEVTGSCLDTKPAIDMMPRGIQYKCIKWKQD
jgi:hypothetical protein